MQLPERGRFLSQLSVVLVHDFINSTVPLTQRVQPSRLNCIPVMNSNWCVDNTLVDFFLHCFATSPKIDRPLGITHCSGVDKDQYSVLTDVTDYLHL